MRRTFNTHVDRLLEGGPFTEDEAVEFVLDLLERGRALQRHRQALRNEAEHRAWLATLSWEQVKALHGIDSAALTGEGQS